MGEVDAVTYNDSEEEALSSKVIVNTHQYCHREGARTYAWVPARHGSSAHLDNGICPGLGFVWSAVMQSS
jgi:hypothetical protein